MVLIWKEGGKKRGQGRYKRGNKVKEKEISKEREEIASLCLFSWVAIYGVHGSKQRVGRNRW